jgi:hypothetical protein
MPRFGERQAWSSRLGWLAGELVVIFIGVSAAFVIENYRDNRSQAAEFDQAISGLIAELTRTETRGREFADMITDKVDDWEKADRNHQRAIPGYYRIPGSTHPPASAWNSMVSSGLVRLIEPELRTELGYFYSEFVGIHDNYDRYNEFTERQILPKTLSGPDAFYGPDGNLLPEFRVQMNLEKEFAADLRALSIKAHQLRIRLEAEQSK